MQKNILILLKYKHLKMRELIYQIIVNQLDRKKKDWIDQKTHQLSVQFSASSFYTIFASAPRFVGKETLQTSAENLSKANALRRGFSPQNWTADRAARVLFILYLPTESKEDHLKILDTLFQTAEINELVALYSALPLLPFPEQYAKRCAEGIRTNMSVVFEAVALHNPFPSEYLDENAWQKEQTLTWRKSVRTMHTSVGRQGAKLAPKYGCPLASL
jgi:hypothetical protein